MSSAHGRPALANATGTPVALRTHRAHQLTDDDVAWADLVVTMEASQVRALRRAHVGAAAQGRDARLLARELPDGPTAPSRCASRRWPSRTATPDDDDDVEDPAGGDDAAYDATMAALVELLRAARCAPRRLTHASEARATYDPAVEVADSVIELIGNTPLVRLHHVTDGAQRRGAREGRVPEPRRLGEGPDRRADDRRGGGVRRARAGRDDRRADERQHRRRPRARRPAARLPLRLRRARQGELDKIAVLRAYGAEVVVCPTAVEPEDPRSYYQVSDRLAARDRRRLQARPVREPREPRGALRDDRPRAVATDRRDDHPLRRGRRHRAGRSRGAGGT